MKLYLLKHRVQLRIQTAKTIAITVTNTNDCNQQPKLTQNKN